MKLHDRGVDKHAVHESVHQEDVMLVIKRKKGESFTIQKDGEVIEVVIVRKTGASVSIGVKASPEYKIVRDNAKKVH